MWCRICRQQILRLQNLTSFCSDLAFDNPLYLFAFFTEVIYQAITAKQNKPICLYTFVAESAGKRMRILIDANQLRSVVE